MNRSLQQITLVVRDYDEAIDFYCRKLGFQLMEDAPLTETKRWVVVSPDAGKGASLLLAKAANEEQKAYIGRQTGGRVFLFLYTDDIDQEISLLEKHQIKITSPKRHENYGKVIVFEDLYGNLWDVIQKN